MSGTEARGRRGDIQGLRALAILTVVVFHAFPAVLPGGFVGVDVFFVISGFLITGILIREQSATGTISLTGFWARRVRRLLPAILAVSLATLVVSSFRLDSISLVRTFDNAAWSLLSLANVHFANTVTGGYFANPVPNPFLHYWSLSVEEQFYVFLPLLLLLVGLVRRQWAVPALIAAVFVSSLAASILLSSENDPNAFYSLGTRAWELAIGAGLAWLASVSRSQPARWARGTAFVLGFVGIAVAAVFYTSSMSWPGYAALLPAVGAALIIWSGTGGSAGRVSRVLDNPGARYVGDVSFSFYLWHWPVLVLAPAMFSGNPWFQAIALVISFGLAALTYRFVEQPFQHMRRGAKAWRVLALGLPLAVVMSAVSFGAAVVAMPNSGVRAQALPAQYQTLSDGPGTVPAAVPTNVRPSLLDVGSDVQQVYRDCFGPGVPECWSGDPDGTRTVLVTGDSFAGMFWPSIEQAAKERGWRAVIVARAGCALLEPAPYGEDAPQSWIDCVEWQGAALERAAQIKPDAIIYVNSMPRTSGDDMQPWVDAAKGAVTQLSDVAPVVVLGPTPIFPWVTEQCLGKNFFEPAACSLPLDEVVTPESRALASDIADSAGTPVFDLDGILCDAQRVCPMIVNDTLMYRDSGHISNAYSTHFAKVFGDLLDDYLN